MKLYFCTTVVIPRDPLADPLAPVCRASLKNLRKLVKRRREEIVTGLKNKIATADEQHLKAISFKYREKYTKDLRDASDPVDQTHVYESLIRSGFHGSVTVQKPFLRK